jgi:NADP-dependent 3-hydroxy acid dehydrogenase YdfG
MSSAAGHLAVPGLDGAAVIVTGGGGIGAAAARQLALAGAAVVLAGRRANLLEEVADGIIAGGCRWDGSAPRRRWPCGSRCC